MAVDRRRLHNEACPFQVTHNALRSDSYWRDQPGPEGLQQERVLVLDAPDAQWREDVNFGSFCTKRCALGTGALASLKFTKDQTGATANVSILAATIWPIGKQTIRLYAKNNADGKWYETIIAKADNGQARSLGTHVDAVTGESMAFVSGGSIGVYHGWLSPKRGAGQNAIIWKTGADNAELNSGDTPCSGAGKRFMAFAEVQGILFTSQCWDVYARTDGRQNNCKPDEVSVNNQCQPRWRKFWTTPDQSGSGSGLRGLTSVEGNNVLIAGYEGAAKARIYRIDPKTGEGTTELNVADTLTHAWGMPTAYIIASYSGPMPLWYGADGRGRRIIGLHANIADSGVSISSRTSPFDAGATAAVFRVEQVTLDVGRRALNDDPRWGSLVSFELREAWRSVGRRSSTNTGTTASGARFRSRRFFSLRAYSRRARSHHGRRAPPS